MGRSPAHRFAFMVFLIALSLSGALGPAAAEPARKPSQKRPSLLLITTTDDCQCALDRCLASRRVIDSFRRSNPSVFDLQVVDVSKTPEAVGTYKVVYTPVVILRDSEGTDVARFDTFFTGADLRQAWASRKNSSEKPK